MFVTCRVQCRTLDLQDFSLQSAMQGGALKRAIFLLPVECNVERSTYRILPCGVQCRVGALKRAIYLWLVLLIFHWTILVLILNSCLRKLLIETKLKSWLQMNCYVPMLQQLFTQSEALIQIMPSLISADIIQGRLIALILYEKPSLPFLKLLFHT